MSEIAISALPTRGIGYEAALERVTNFAQQYGEAHLALACHAAFPLALTPDLLYQIWANFVPEAPWTAISDVLLSSLCREVGFELYEMDISTRNMLLKELMDDERYGKQRFDELVDFLTTYTAYQLYCEDVDVQSLARAQQWTALTYTRPDTTIQILEMALTKYAGKYPFELFHLTSLIDTFAQSLSDYIPLLGYARDLFHSTTVGNKQKIPGLYILPRQGEVVEKDETDTLSSIASSMPDTSKGGVEKDSSNIPSPLRRLLLSSIYSPADQELILRAYRVAEQAHQGQMCASGEPYITHSIAVAAILGDMHVPAEVVAAGLLHDTVEDTNITLDDIRRDFGLDVAHMVDGVTQVMSLPRVSRDETRPKDTAREGDERQIVERGSISDANTDDKEMLRIQRYDIASETLRKTLIAMGEDVRVALIKLADRLHDMRTLSYMPEHKRRRMAQETLDMFAPLASRLGIWQIKWELEDLGFRYLYPDKYKEIAISLEEHLADREREMAGIITRLEKLMGDNNIRAEITSRPKHIYSIYKDMERKGVPFEMVYNVRGVRVIVPDIPTCYVTLGLIHACWPPFPGGFDDYIAAPKDNFYRSLHTAVVYDDGKTLEAQIRTPEMHQDAEFGFAAHLRYKEGGPHDESYKQRINWWRSIMNWREGVEDAGEFVDGLKTDVFGDRVYVFTPKGDIIDLPAGSTPIDFAYHIHTDIGHRCRGAKVNGKLVSLDYALKTGEKVDILTAKRGGPSRDWLNPNLGLVKTQRARDKIRDWFKRQAREYNILHGKDMLEKELSRLGIVNADLELLAQQFEFRLIDDLYFAIGCGDLPLQRIANRMMLDEKDDDGQKFGSRPLTSEPARQSYTVAVPGLKGLQTRMGRCCNPVPGDPIIGYITRGRGATIHRSDCPNILRIKDREHLVRVSWGEQKNTYPVSVRIKAYDHGGLFKDVSTLISDEGLNMENVVTDATQNRKLNLVVVDFIIEVSDISQLARVLTRLEVLPNVLEARRMGPR